MFSYDKISLANINKANQYFYNILAKAQAYVNSITVVDTNPTLNLQISSFSCDTPAIDIGGSGGTYNRVGIFKEVTTYKKCPNQPQTTCMKYSQENGALKVETRLDTEIDDDDTCQVENINLKIVRIDKLDKQTTLPIKTDSEGRYIEEMTDCSESGDEEYISSLPANIEQNAVVIQKYMGDNSTEEVYVVKENGGYMQYSKASQNGRSLISKVSCEFDGTIKSYFKGNTLVEENDVVGEFYTSNIQDIVTTRIK